jgi:hypothetical protein
VTTEPHDGLVVVHISYSWPEAEVLVSMLEAAGISAILADRLTIANNWHLAVALGGFRILVLESSKADAQRVIAEFQGAASDGRLPESESFHRQPVKNSLWLLFSVFFGWCPAWLRQRRSGDG